jgi:hypothetical protein
MLLRPLSGGHEILEHLVPRWRDCLTGYKSVCINFLMSSPRARVLREILSNPTNLRAAVEGMSVASAAPFGTTV